MPVVPPAARRGQPGLAGGRRPGARRGRRDRRPAGRQRRGRAAPGRARRRRPRPGRGDPGAAVRRASGGFGGAPKFPPSMVLEFLLRQHERTGSARGAAPGRGDRGADGPRRDVRPAGRRLRPVQRGRAVGGAALREDALRQRAAAAGATRTWPGSPGTRCRGGSPTETAAFLLRDLRTAGGRLRLGAGRGHRRRRGADLRLDPGPAARGARRRRRRPGPAELLGGDRGRARSSTARSTLQLPADPDDPARWARVRGRAAGRPERAARSRPATTR